MFDIEDQEPEVPREEDLGIDLESDPVDVRDVIEEDESQTDLSPDELGAIDNVELDNVLDEFVEVFNARDLDGLGELLAPDAQSGLLGESSRTGVVEGFNDLLLRYPTLLVTRGDIGSDPIVAAWIFDQEADRFDPFGYFTLELGDSGEGRLQRVEYWDELPVSEDVVVEAPDRSDLPEWEDWSQLDED